MRAVPLTILALAVLAAPAPAAPATTGGATSTGSGATLEGTADTAGCATETTYGWEWGTSPERLDQRLAGGTLPPGGGIVTVTGQLDGLTEYSPYAYRFVTACGAAEERGAVRCFHHIAEPGRPETGDCFPQTTGNTDTGEWYPAPVDGRRCRIGRGLDWVHGIKTRNVPCRDLRAMLRQANPRLLGGRRTTGVRIDGVRYACVGRYHDVEAKYECTGGRRRFWLAVDGHGTWQPRDADYQNLDV